MQVTNNNTNPDTALYIMIVFDKILVNERVETNPYIGECLTLNVANLYMNVRFFGS